MQIIYANIKRCSLQDVPKIVPLSLSKALLEIPMCVANLVHYLVSPCYKYQVSLVEVRHFLTKDVDE